MALWWTISLVKLKLKEIIRSSKKGLIKIPKPILIHFGLADWRKKEWLKWPQRMAVTIGIARGVQFLHTGVAPGIFGNNLKIENILLDESVSAKISNYNLPLPFQVRICYSIYMLVLSNLKGNLCSR